MLAILLFFGAASLADAHVPHLVEQESLRDITTVERPEVSKAYYGEMTGFPHTFEIVAQKSFYLSVDILQPDIATSKHNISGIIIKEVEGSGRVTEVTRLRAHEAAWESFFEPFGGDTYRQGSSFEQMVDAGVYRVEVNTPENREKYVLVVGKIEDGSEIGYIETVRRLAAVKVFFEKSPVRVIESPLVYVPLILIIGIALASVYLYRRKKKGV